MRLFLALGTLVGCEDGVKDRAFHARHEFNDCHITNVLDEAIDDVVAEIAMGHLASAEAQTCLDLIATSQKPDGLVLLGLVIVIIDGHRKLDFLHGDDLLLFARGALGLFLLVEITAVVLDAADGRGGVGRDFDQVESPLTGDAERFKRRQDAELFAIFVDHADFAGANAIVNADKRLGRAFIECDGASSRGVRRPDPECSGILSKARERTLSIALPGC